MTLLSALVLAACAEDGARPKTPDDVAQATVDRKWPGSRILNAQAAAVAGRTEYEVTIEVPAPGEGQARYLDLVLRADGRVAFQREKVRWETLPLSVREGWKASKYGSAATPAAKRIVLDEQEEAPRFRFVVQWASGSRTITLDQDGRVVEDVAYRSRGLYEHDAGR